MRSATYAAVLPYNEIMSLLFLDSDNNCCDVKVSCVVYEDRGEMIFLQKNTWVTTLRMKIYVQIGLVQLQISIKRRECSVFSCEV